MFVVKVTTKQGVDSVHTYEGKEAVEAFTEGVRFMGASAEVTETQEAVLSRFDYAETGNCPACGKPCSDDVTALEKDHDDGIVFQKKKCTNCGATWTAVHELMRYEDLRDARDLPIDDLD